MEDAGSTGARCISITVMASGKSGSRDFRNSGAGRGSDAAGLSMLNFSALNRGQPPMAGVTLIGRYVGHPPDTLTICCESLSLIPARVRRTFGADGSPEDVVGRAYILVKEVAVVAMGSLQSMQWKPTHLLFSDPGTGNEKESAVNLVEIIAPDTVQFVDIDASHA